MRSPALLENRTSTVTEDRTAQVDLQGARVEGNTLHGYALLYGVQSEMIEDRGRRFTETIERGALDDVLASNPDTYLSLNHDPSRILARMPDTLRLYSEERGLRFEADLGDGPTAQDVRDAVKRGVLRGASFRFGVADGGDRWERQGDGSERRTLTKIGRLVDISIATVPAYAGTSIELRSRPEGTSPLTVSMRDGLTGTGADESRAAVALAPEDRMANWGAIRRMRSTFSESEAREFSIGRAIRGMVTGSWEDADLERRALSEGSDSAGGFAVPSPLAAFTIDRIRNAAQVIAAGATTVPMESETLTIPRLSGAITPTWKKENEPVAESDPEFARVTLSAKTLPVLVKLSVELFEDMTPSASDRITQELVAAVGLGLDFAALRGSGTDPEPLGVRNTEGVELRSMGSNGAKPTDWKPYVQAVAAVRRRNVQPNAILLSSRSAETQALLTDTTGQPLRMPPYLEGIDFRETNQISDAIKQGTSNATSEAYVGRWSDLLIGLRPALGIRVRQLNERFMDNLQIGLLAYLRADVAVAHTESFAVITGLLE
jgi:HK97 family phage major capsid protein/HK97 family phage prohead protease